MAVLHTLSMIVAFVSGLGLIVAVMLQTNKAESFSAAMGGSGDSGRYRKGSREEMIDRLTKFAAIIWISSCVANAVVYGLLHK